MPIIQIKIDDNDKETLKKLEKLKQYSGEKTTSKAILYAALEHIEISKKLEQATRQNRSYQALKDALSDVLDG